VNNTTTQVERAINSTMRYHTKYYKQGQGLKELRCLVNGVSLYYPKIGFQAGLVKWLALILTNTCEEVLGIDSGGVSYSCSSAVQTIPPKVFGVVRFGSILHPTTSRTFSDPPLS
jgi:hypothetical protein